MKRRDWLPALLLVWVVFILRLWGLTSSSLWYDETFMVYHAQRGVFAALAGLLREDNALPLHGLLLALWARAAGSGEFAVRYLSVLLGTLAAPLLLRAVAELLAARPRRLAGWGAVAAYATLPMYVYYTQEVRMYALVIPLAAAFAWMGVRAVRRGRDVPAYVILGVAALTAHLYAGLLWVTLWLWGMLALVLAPDRESRRSSSLRAWWRANALLLVCALPIAGWALWRAGVDATATSGIPAATLRWIPVLWGVGQYLPEPWASGFVAVWALASLAALAYLLHSRRFDAALWLVTLLSLPLLLLLGATLIKAKWSERYLLPSFGLGVVVAAGLGWELLLEARERGSVLLRVVGGVLLASWLALTLPALARQAAGTWALRIRDEWHPRPDFRGVAHYIAERDAATDAIVVVGGYAAHTLDYYYDGPARLFGLPFDTRMLDLQAPVDLRALEILERESPGATRLWLVLWQESLADPTGLIQSVLVDQCTRLPVSAQFINVNLLLFDLADCRPLDRLATPPHPADEAFVAPIRWIGYNVIRGETTWEVDLWWASGGPLTEDYTVFVHLMDAEGRSIAQHDHIAGSDVHPTSRWPAGTRLRDRFFLDVPESACDAGCSLYFGLYTPEGRLPLADGRDAVTLAVDGVGE